jgi:uncharacterized protein (UPF0261 family)
MRELAIGVPKLMVSTMASGETRPYVGTSDICMMYSVVDFTGLNRLTKVILRNAASAILGMIGGGAVGGMKDEAEDEPRRPLLAATMFGVTTPCVNQVKQALDQAGFELLVFHATGSGGQAMERIIRDGFIEGVLDITTTELADELVGGVLSAGPTRMEAAGRIGIPQVISVGALDMVNFGPRDTVPSQFSGRNLYQHNATVTLMRTTLEESTQLGRIVAEKANAAKGPVTIVLPLKGISAIDAPGRPFDDPAADHALFEALRHHSRDPVRIVEVDAHINDPEFAAQLVGEFIKMSRGEQHAVRA